MRLVRIVLLGLAAAWLLTAQSAQADDGWSLKKLNPFDRKEVPRTPPAPKPEWMRKMDRDMHRLNNGIKTGVHQVGTGTKRLLVGTWDTITLKRFATQPTQPKKPSWFSSMFTREEPKRVESMKDWVGLPRPEH